MKIKRVRAARHRSNMQAAGFRLIQMWVSDTRSKALPEECRKESLSLYNDPAETEMLDWAEKAADTEEWR